MTPQEATLRLEHALAKDPAGRYSFQCKKAFVLVKLYGSADRMRFTARDKLAFRTDANCLTIEKCDSGAVQRRFTWEEIECLAAGEPEVDNGPLFQG